MSSAEEDDSGDEEVMHVEDVANDYAGDGDDDDQANRINSQMSVTQNVVVPARTEEENGRTFRITGQGPHGGARHYGSKQSPTKRVVHIDRTNAQQEYGAKPAHRHRFSESQMTPKSYDEAEHGHEVFFEQQRTTHGELEREMMLYHDAHDGAETYFRHRYFAMVSFVLLLSFAATVLAGWMEFDPDGADDAERLKQLKINVRFYKYVVTSLSGMISLMITLIVFLKYQSKMDAHSNAAARFGELYKSFHFTTFANQFTYLELDELLKKIDSTKQSFMEVVRSNPYALPSAIRVQLNKDMRQKVEKQKTKFRKLSHARNPVVVTPANVSQRNLGHAVKRNSTVQSTVRSSFLSKS